LCHFLHFAPVGSPPAPSSRPWAYAVSHGCCMDRGFSLRVRCAAVRISAFPYAYRHFTRSRNHHAISTPTPA
jgi:hypothetical protein